ncbi:MAG: glycosyltransferase family protein [Nitrososphaerales archaeon]
MKPIYIPVFGSGLGHATRMHLVSERLRGLNIPTVFSSSREGLEFLKGKGLNCVEVPNLDVVWGENGDFSTSKTLRAFPNLLRTFVSQVRIEAKNMDSLSPSLVLADSKLSAVVASSVRELPCVTILNQLRLSMAYRNLSRLFAFVEDLWAEFFGYIWSQSQHLLIPDFRPPYTISEFHTGGVKSASSKLKYVGPLMIKEAPGSKRIDRVKKHLKLGGKKGIIFAQISGPRATKVSLLKQLREVASKNGGHYDFILSEGESNGIQTPEKIDGGWQFEWCPFREELFSLSDLVVIRGGHSSILQSTKYGKPMLLTPIPKHSEQIMNSRKVESLGAGVLIDPMNLNQETIDEGLQRVMSENSISSRAAHLQRIFEAYDGLQDISRIAGSYA